MKLTRGDPCASVVLFFGAACRLFHLFFRRKLIMGNLEAMIYDVVCNINTYLANYILIFLLVGVGLW